VSLFIQSGLACHQSHPKSRGDSFYRIANAMSTPTIIPEIFSLWLSS